jgi:hypothetical protein
VLYERPVEDLHITKAERDHYRMLIGRPLTVFVAMDNRQELRHPLSLRLSGLEQGPWQLRLQPRLGDPVLVGRAVGWPDQNYFARRFKAHFGLSASAYRHRFTAGVGRQPQAPPNGDRMGARRFALAARG